MPVYEYRCECGMRTEIEKPMGMVSRPERCYCGQTLQRVYSSPLINWNKWNPNYRQNEMVDGDIDFQACGGDEEFRAEMGLTPKQVPAYEEAVRNGEVE